MFFTGVAGLTVGVNRVLKSIPNVVISKSNIFLKAFSPDGSYFGYRSYFEHRNLAYKYGRLLTAPRRLKNGNNKHIHALGHENSQALVSFAYGTPNNTLPIIYSTGNDSLKWTPLIPRFSQDKISVARDFRKSISHELSILREFGSDNILDNFFSLKVKKANKTFTTVNHIDFSIYAIIKLKRNGLGEANICHRLGITYSDYEGYIKQGVQRGIFDQDAELTIFGLELFGEARKCISLRKKSISYEARNTFKVRNVNYIPKIFNGRS